MAPKPKPRVNAADAAASTNYGTAAAKAGAAVSSAQIKVNNLIAQLKVLRRWYTNTANSPTQNYVELPNDWFSKPPAGLPWRLPNSDQPWDQKTKFDGTTAGDSGRYYVFKDIQSTVSVWNQRKIYAADINGAIALWKSKLAAAQTALAAAKASAAAGGAAAVGGPSSAGTTPNNGTFITKADLDAKPVIVNVSSVREAYFSARATAADVASAIAGATTAYAADGHARVGLNVPSAITDAADLWLNVQGSKGMIQTYFPPNGFDDKNTDSSQAFNKKYDLNKYGFQFMYNPTTISMDYFGTQNVDVAYMMSGSDKFNYVPSSGNSGAITFQILINRIFDMAYYVPNGTGGGLLVPGAEEFYGARAPYGVDWKSSNADLFDEQSAIYNKGTMYDIEYLLRTILGFKMKSALRREYTADMGFFSRKMVELHLGPKMRYRGYVNSLHIDHAMFNERMVPTLSRVSITFNRFPDYANNSASGSTETRATTTAIQNSAATTANQKALAAGAQGRVN